PAAAQSAPPMPASPPSAPSRRSWPRRLFRGLVALLLVPVLLFEEWGWEPLAALVARLGRLPVWAALERAIRRLPRPAPGHRRGWHTASGVGGTMQQGTRNEGGSTS
ncbi:hypothetical protein, partial [Micromonospora sp.]|uniref:hypothetical protein n=1 Tax=Micromonospora sp. TaxID=1876 RepID=UPI003B3B6912